FSDFVFTSLTGFSGYDYDQSVDVDITPSPVIDVVLAEKYDQFSQEFRIEGDLGNKMDYLLGVYYQDSESDNDYFADFNMAQLLTNSVGIPLTLTDQLISGFTRDIKLDQDTRQWAVFGHLNYQFNEQWAGSVGYRYSDMDKSAKQSLQTGDINHNPGVGELVDTRWLSPDLAGLLLGNPDYLADPTGYVLTLADGTEVGPALVPDHLLGLAIVTSGGAVPHSFDDLERKESHSMVQTSLQYQWGNTAMVYASYANGAKAGGFDLLYEGDIPDEAEYLDESANVYELGLKKDFDNLRVNLAAFYGEYDDLQVSVFNGGVGFNVGNAASSISRGIDGEVTYALSEDLTLFANFEYLDFSYDEFRDASCSSTEKLNTGEDFCDWSGRQTPFVPRVKAVVALEAYHPLGNHQLRHLVSIDYKSKHTTTSDNEEQAKQGGYSLIDYRAELTLADENWSLGLTVKNLFDKDYNIFTSSIPLAPSVAIAHALHKGREVFVEARYQF
ncbi:MAG: iron complex outermembrane receptor protein, partial [Alteromonadaceae bacterium]